MHCTLNWKSNDKEHQQFVSVPGAAVLPSTLRALLRADLLIIPSRGWVWLSANGKLRGPFQSSSPEFSGLKIEWSHPALLDKDLTEQTIKKSHAFSNEAWRLEWSDGYHEFRSPILLGRSNSVTHQIESTSVSRVHALILVGEQSVHYFDLGSTNGSYRNQTSRIEQSVLHHNDTIWLGKTEVHFKLASRGTQELETLPSRQMQTLGHLVRRVAKSSAPVLISGESGSGKETIAQAIHEKSGLKGRLVVANASCFSPQLARSELFGHLAGAFTGAKQDKIGLFEAAKDGTLFLDEIGDMSLSVQAELLRALETGYIQPVGSTDLIQARPRIVTATHKNLAHEVQEGRFREDLYYRLFVINLHVPSLRERPEDITHLANVFTARFCQGETLTDEALSWLRVQPWRGNIREFRNLFWKASVMYPDKPTSLFNLQRLLENETSRKPSPAEVIHVLEEMNGNVQRTADQLQIHRSTVHRHLKAHRAALSASAA